MGTYRLSKAITVPMDFIVWSRPEGKSAMRAKVRLEPNEDYELPEGDQLFAQDIASQEIKKRYDPALEAQLKSIGVDYEVTMCKTCGGKKKFVIYKAVEVTIDE